MKCGPKRDIEKRPETLTPEVAANYQSETLILSLIFGRSARLATRVWIQQIQSVSFGLGFKNTTETKPDLKIFCQISLFFFFVCIKRENCENSRINIICFDKKLPTKNNTETT